MQELLVASYVAQFEGRRLPPKLCNLGFEKTVWEVSFLSNVLWSLI